MTTSWSSRSSPNIWKVVPSHGTQAFHRGRFWAGMTWFPSSWRKTQFMKKFFTLDEKLTLPDLQQERQRIFERLLDYICRFRYLSLMCYDPVKEKRLVDICIVGMLYEYRPYFENLQISSFTRLVETSRRTSVSVKKPSKGSTSQTTSTPKQPWKWESKKVKVDVLEEPKKATKGRKWKRSGRKEFLKRRSF